MDNERSNSRPDWTPIVLSHARDPLRPALADLIELDTLLARSVHTASEPALAQIRLAWWREQLEQERAADASDPPDPLLANLLRRWSDGRAELVMLINGWEALVDGPPFPDSAAAEFTLGRAASFRALAGLAGKPLHGDAAAEHGTLWAQAELSHMQAGCAYELPRKPPRLPRALRPLAVIGGLSWRSLRRGGGPLLGDRLSPLVALRLGIFGT